MVLGPYTLSFVITVGATPAAVREWTIRSVTGDGGAPGRSGTLTILDRGPDRFASRYVEGSSSQLRVVEWSGERRAHGAVLHSVGTSPRFSARYALEIETAKDGSRLAIRYDLETPILGLALSFRIARRRALVRRLSASWLRLEDERRWGSVHPRRAGTR